MKKQRRYLIVILVLGLASLACSIFGSSSGDESPAMATTIAPAPSETLEASSAETAPPTETTAAPPTETPETVDAGETPESGDGDGETPPDTGNGPDFIDLDDPDLYAEPAGVETYRVGMVFTFDGIAADGSPVTGTATVDGANVVDPREMSLVLHDDGEAIKGPGEVYTFTQVGGVNYYSVPDMGCMTFSSEGTENPFVMMTEAGGMLGGSAARLLPDETVNGIPSYVFAIDSTNLDPADPTSYDVSEITEGRIYVAKDGFYVVRVLLIGVGTSEGLSGDPTLVGDIYYELNYYDFNQPVEITLPAGCTESGAGTVDSEIPLLDDAFDVSSFPGVIAYSTQYTSEEAVDFYRAEMAAAGWTLDQEVVVAPTTLLTFTNDAGDVIHITIMVDPTSGVTNVAIVGPN